MIDKAGYRAGIGIILVNDARRLFLAKRIGMVSAWQFPQGGMQMGETPRDAMFRELKEEVGLNPTDVEVLACTRHWLRYRLPRQLVRQGNKPLCIGQKQKWFLLRLANPDAKIDFHITDEPEFDSSRWVSYWYPLQHVVSFKRRVYLSAMREFAKIVMAKGFGAC